MEKFIKQNEQLIRYKQWTCLLWAEIKVLVFFQKHLEITDTSELNGQLRLQYSALLEQSYLLTPYCLEEEKEKRVCPWIQPFLNVDSCCSFSVVCPVRNFPSCFRELGSPTVINSYDRPHLLPVSPSPALSLSPPGKELPHLYLI